MTTWLNDGRDVALLIGGPDGLDPALKATADETLLDELRLLGERLAGVLRDHHHATLVIELPAPLLSLGTSIAQ